jgi:hypothetical protein
MDATSNAGCPYRQLAMTKIKNVSRILIRLYENVWGGLLADVTPAIFLHCGAGWQTGGGLSTRLQTA